MPKSDDYLKEIEAEMLVAISKPEIIIDGDNPIPTIRVPADDSISQFIPVSNLPDISKLPPISERNKDFAFRYATEYKSRVKWAEEYGVHVNTIAYWLADPVVVAYIAFAHFEQGTYNMAQRVVLNRRVYQTINRIMNMRLTADTVGPVASMVKFVYNILNSPDDNSSRTKRDFNLSIGIANAPQPISTPYKIEDTSGINTVTPKALVELKESIDELERMAEDYEVDV